MYVIVIFAYRNDEIRGEKIEKKEGRKHPDIKRRLWKRVEGSVALFVNTLL